MYLKWIAQCIVITVVVVCFDIGISNADDVWGPVKVKPGNENFCEPIQSSRFARSPVNAYCSLSLAYSALFLLNFQTHGKDNHMSRSWAMRYIPYLSSFCMAFGLFIQECGITSLTMNVARFAIVFHLLVTFVYSIVRYFRPPIDYAKALVGILTVNVLMTFLIAGPLHNRVFVLWIYNGLLIGTVLMMGAAIHFHANYVKDVDTEPMFARASTLFLFIGLMFFHPKFIGACEHPLLRYAHGIWYIMVAISQTMIWIYFQSDNFKYDVLTNETELRHIQENSSA